MFKKETEYALRGLVYIQFRNLKGLRPGITEIASEIGTPQHFTAKILHRLVRLGFVRSLKGKNGGFFFDPEKPDLPLKKVIVAIEGDTLFSGCGFGLNQCDESKPCPLHDAYASIRNSIDRLVTVETVQSLASKSEVETDIILNRE